MKYKVTFFICLLTIVFYTYSQEETNDLGLIRGVVLDVNTKQPIPYATIVVKLGDKTKTGGITDTKGKFSIGRIPFGDYRVEIQFIGYRTAVRNISLLRSKRSINLDTIFIQEDAVALESVEINVERSTIEQKIDRKVITVGKDLITVGASATDIMSNIPSVSINQDGEISLRGNENVRILIDGKPTNVDASQLLQQIPSTSIEKIELITNPSAKYNPEGMSGIINIILKKNTKLGLNGNLNLGSQFAQRTRLNSALSLNNRTGKFNVYGSYGNRFGKQITDGTVTRLIENTNQLTTNVNDRTSHLFKVGVDYYINTNNTVSIYTNQNMYKATFDGLKEVTFFDDIVSKFQLDDLLTRDNFTQTYNIDYKHNFNEKHNIELEFDYNSLVSDLVNDFKFLGNSALNDYREDVHDNRTNTTINLDYTYSIRENSLLELGLETRLRRTNNKYETANLNLNNSTFFYDRDIFSFYTTWSQSYSKIAYNIGVRLEDYNVVSDFNEVGKPVRNFENKIFSIFPSGFLRFMPSDDQKNVYQLSFSRRIDRPSLNQINPIRQATTPQIIVIGNQALNPQFTSSIELNYTKKIPNGSLSGGFFYRKIQDEINRVGYFDTVDPNLLILDYANFSSNDAYGFELTSSYKPTSWWSFNGSFDMYARRQKGVIEEENVSVNNTLINFKLNNSLKINKVLTFQLFGFYSGRQKILQYELKDNYYVNAGARYNLARGKGTFSINFNDIFGTQRFAFEAYRTIIQEGQFLRDTKSIFFGFSYRFGSSKNAGLKRKKRDKNEKADRFL